MNGRLPLLAALLIVQLLIIAAVVLVGEESGDAALLLELEPEAVTGLEIEDGEGATVMAVRADGGWTVDGLPADGDKLLDAIEALGAGRAAWPVATSAGARERFEVEDDAFQRRVQLTLAEADPVTLYLGTSPGFRRVHARREGEDAIYSIDFGVHQLPTDLDDWLDKGLLQSSGLEGIVFDDGRRLQLDAEGAWRLDDAATDAEAVMGFVERIEGLTVLGRHEEPIGGNGGETAEDAGEAGTASVPAIASGSLSLETAAGSQRLDFRFNADADEYVVTSDRHPGAYRVASYLVEQMLIAPEELLAPLAPDAPAADTPTAESPAAADGPEVLTP